MHKKKSIQIALILLLIICSSFASANIFFTKEAQKIYTSKELTIKQVTTGGANIAYGNPNLDLSWITADLDSYPKNSFRQEILEEIHNPMYESKSADSLLYKWEDVSTPQIKYETTYKIKTKSDYKQIKEKIDFPIQKNKIPQDIQIFLKETEKIDFNQDITNTAKEIAQNKDDLFEVAQDVAYWIHTNIEYDLNTLTSESSQNASWVLTNKKGVCDEISVLYISMMRSLGIPARYVSGISYTNSDLFDKDWIPHAWTEVYFPEYGWVPFDLTYAQFGFIDASHVSFKKSHDAKSISSKFLWEAYSLNKIDVSLMQSNFDMSILEYSGTIEDEVDFEIITKYPKIKQGSYNLFELKLTNKANHYFSSIISLAAPNEIKIQGKKEIPIFLKPNEEKTYYIPFSTDNSLDRNLIYDMPISAYNQYGIQKDTDFSVSINSPYYSIDEINKYINSQKNESSSTKKVNIICNFKKEEIGIGEENILNCKIQNNYDKILSETLCIINTTKGISISEGCQTFSIEKNNETNLELKINATKIGTNEIELKLRGHKITERSSFLVLDKPKLEIVEFKIPETVDVNLENQQIVVLIEKQSMSIAKNIKLTISFNDKIESWDLNDINSKTELKININPYLLNEGENKIKATLEYSDKKTNKYSSTKESTTTLNKLSFLDKITSFFYKLVS